MRNASHEGTHINGVVTYAACLRAKKKKAYLRNLRFKGWFLPGRRFGPTAAFERYSGDFPSTPLTLYKT